MNDCVVLNETELKLVNEYNSDEFALGRMAVLSTTPNTHGIPFTDDDLLKYGDTVKGKWVVCYFNGLDATDHHPREHIVGIIPKEQEVEYIRKDDGNLVMYVNVLLSKIYSKEIVDIFKQNNNRNVSVEVSVNYENEDKEKIKDFNILGVTILGKYVAGSCPDANMEIVKFSKIDEQFRQFKEKEYCDFIKFARGEKDNMANQEKDKNLEDENVTMSENNNDVKDSKNNDTAQDDNKTTQDDVQENKDDSKTDSKSMADEDTMSCDSKKTMSCIKDMADEDTMSKCKLSDDVLEMSLNQLLEYVSEMSCENSKLKEDNAKLSDFKNECDKKELSCKLSNIMKMAKENLSDDIYMEVENMSKEVSLENIENFENNVKAKIYDYSLSKKEEKQVEEVAKMGSVNNTINTKDEELDVWKRIERK